MFDMFNLMNKAKEMQQKVMQIQEELAYKTVTGEAAAGMVKVTANGKRKVMSIEIDSTLVDKNDTKTLSDLIVAATNNALQKAEELAKEEIRKGTEGILPNIPGVDLSKFNF